MNLTKFLKIVILLLFAVLVFITNYTPGTYLSGWDNLHPEFNFALNIKRSIFSVWQEYQGLGLLGGMGHASFLPHQIILWLVSFVVPQNLIRYLYHFSLLLIGALGAYFLVKNIVEKKEIEHKDAAGIAASLFYIFNLSTVQMFNVPYEAYSTCFAALPWLFLTVINYLKAPTRRNLLLLIFVNILATPQGYVGTFFLVYCMLLGLFMVFQLKHLKRVLIIVLITFLTNAFWLLPNLYFVATSSAINIESKINLMATEDNFLKNKKYGGLENTAILKGFWFDNTEIGINREKIIQMSEWENYLKNPFILGLGYLIFASCMLGLLYIVKSKSKTSMLFVPLFILGFTVISNNTPILSSFASLFNKVPLFSQVFRFPYTKFAIPVSLFLSIFYAFSLLYLLPKCKKTITASALFFVFLLMPIVFTSPLVSGKLFYERVKVNIPNEYFQVFDFFKTQNKNERIANFPQVNYWGWTFYNWNYSGSGFLWYGIEQPILDRAFDPWSNYNENYYWELSNALYSKNLPLIESVLEKYQISWILLDENVINPTSSKALLFEDTIDMLANTSKVTLTKSFGNIHIYKVNRGDKTNNYIFAAENLPTVGPGYNWNNLDLAYFQKGNYKLNADPKYYYPFDSLFTGRSPDNNEFEITETENSFIISKNLSINDSEYKLVVPNTDFKELVYLNGQNLEATYYSKIDIKYGDGKIIVEFPKIKGLYSAQITPNNRSVFNLPDLPHNLSYLISIDSKNIKGKSLLFWLENTNLRKSDLESYLPKNKSSISYFIQPPMEKDGLGYTLHFDNISIGKEISLNDLNKITVNLLPYKFLTNLRFVKDEGELPAETYAVNSTHPNPSLYELTMENLKVGESTIVLSQGYHKDWNAYKLNSKIPSFFAPFIGEKIKDHVIINNWENGWKVEKGVLENNTNIVIIFLPQYLQYFGFALLLTPLIFIKLLS